VILGDEIIKKQRILKLLIVLSAFCILLPYILLILALLNIKPVLNIIYGICDIFDIFGRFGIPIMFSLELVSVLILIFDLKKNIINEKYAWFIFICVVFGIIGVVMFVWVNISVTFLGA
jgi:hypothetical protein